MIEILSSSCLENKKYLVLVRLIVISIFVFIWVKIHLILLKKNLIAYDKMNCLDFLLIDQKIRLCDMCSISVTFVMVDQLKRINLIWKISSATACLIRHIIWKTILTITYFFKYCTFSSLLIFFWFSLFTLLKLNSFTSIF